MTSIPTATPRLGWLLLCTMLLATACEPYWDSQDFHRDEVLVHRARTVVEPPDPGSPARLRVMA